MLLTSVLSAVLGSAATAAVFTWRRARPRRTGYHARIVDMPHPEWKPGQKQPGPYASGTWTQYDPSQHEKAAVYPLVRTLCKALRGTGGARARAGKVARGAARQQAPVSWAFTPLLQVISTFVPRPIALVSSIDKVGLKNHTQRARAVAADTVCRRLGILTCAWIVRVGTCVLQTGHVNLAPYSYFNAMGHDPVVFCIGINRSPGRGGGKKDTLMNIEETGYVLHTQTRT